MAADELESFIKQFKYLSSAGYYASLQLTTENGAVKVSFDVSLGFMPPPLTRPPPYHVCSPQTSGKKRNSSYLRRQEKRRGLQAESDSTSVSKLLTNANGSSQSDEKDARDASVKEHVETIAIKNSAAEVESRETYEVVYDKLDANTADSKDAKHEELFQSSPSKDVNLLKDVSCVSTSASLPLPSKEDATAKLIALYADHNFEPECFKHRHIPGRGAHNVPPDASQCCYHRCGNRSNRHFLPEKLKPLS